MRRLVLLLSVILTFALPPIKSYAESTLVFKVVAIEAGGGAGPQGKIYAGSRGIFTLSGRGWQSVSDAEMVAQRLNALVEAGLRPDEIKVVRSRRTRAIVARGRTIIQIDRKLAKARNASIASLAQTWANRLKREFSQPYLSVSPMVVPVGETRSILVKGNIVGELAVRPAAAFISAVWVPSVKSIRVKGLIPGQTELIVEDEASSLAVPIRAARYAASLMQPLTAVVTGEPASTDTVSRAVNAAVIANLELEAGAWVGVTPAVSGITPPSPGKAIKVPVQVSAAGEGYLAYRKRPLVQVKNERVPREQAETLLVSNSPERLLSTGLWYEARVRDSQRVRFLYHHVNHTGVSCDLVIELWNLSAEIARVQVIAGAGGPTMDEAWGGHRAAKSFLFDRARNAGWIAPILPGKATPVFVHQMSLGATSSGILELKTLGKADLSLRLYLQPRQPEWLPRPIDKYTESPILGQWQYPQPWRQLNARYVVGQEWAFVSIGDQAATGIKEGDRLLGDYGVMYEIMLELVNPTPDIASIAITLEPAGGPARGVLSVEGRQIETALLRNRSEDLLARYELRPGQTTKIRVETMPQSGSNYPVRLVARAVARKPVINAAGDKSPTLSTNTEKNVALDINAE